MTAPDAAALARATEALKEALSAVNAPGVDLPPWQFRTDDGGPESARRKSIGVCGGCSIEHDHNNEDDPCVLTEFAVVWNNDCRLEAKHADNSGTLATANALVEAFNAVCLHGDTILAALRSRDEAIAQAVAAENDACLAACQYIAQRYESDHAKHGEFDTIMEQVAQECAAAIRARREPKEGKHS